MGDQKHGVREEFDAKADIYDSNRLAGWYHAHNDAIAKHLDCGPEARLLDIGCARGYLIRSILNGNPSMCAVGVDFSPRMIFAARTAAAELGGRSAFYCDDWECPGDALMNDLASDQPSHAVCASTMHYFSDPVAALRRVHQYLRPGGTLILLERRLEQSAMTRAWDLAHRYFINDHVRFFRTDELLEMFEAAGFARAEVIETVKKIFWKNKITTNLSLIRATK